MPKKTTLNNAPAHSEVFPGEGKPWEYGVYMRQLGNGSWILASYGKDGWMIGHSYYPGVKVPKQTSHYRSGYQSRPWKGLAQAPA